MANKRCLLAACTAGIIVVAAVSCAQHLSGTAQAAIRRPSPVTRGTGHGSRVTSHEYAEMEARILGVLEDMYKDDQGEALDRIKPAFGGQGACNITPEDGRLLRVLTEAIGAKHVVEIGTCHGYSALWFCLALQRTGGKLITHEIDPNRVAMARKNFKRAGVEHIVTLVEGDAHKTVMKLKAPIDIVFLDADKPGNIDYLNKLLPLVRPGGLILAHNTTDLESLMQDYLEAVTTNPDLETIFLHKDDRGIGVTLKKL
jgi:caffeoyl-CoA O-methyltransferase